MYENVEIKETVGKTDEIEVGRGEWNEAVEERLIELSRLWEEENSCHGYCSNKRETFAGRRLFLARAGNTIVGYLFGLMTHAERETSVLPLGTPFFEVEELYVLPSLRDRGIGRKLFRLAEKDVADEAEMILLSTATKDCRAILHFYMDELGMEFWNARLFRRISR